MDKIGQKNELIADIIEFYKTKSSILDTQLEETIKRNMQLEIINQIAKSITIEMSFDEMMEDVSGKLLKIISYDLLNLCIIEGGDLIVKKQLPRSIKFLKEGTVLNPKNSWSWEVVRKKRFSIRSDMQNDGEVFTKDLALVGIKSMVIVPILTRTGVIGTLNLGSKRIGEYKIDDAFFLQQVADQLALIIENGRLYKEETLLREKWEESYKMVTKLMQEKEKRNVQLEIINEIAKSITIEMSFEDIMNSLREKLGQVISCDYAGLCLLDKGKLIVKACNHLEHPVLGIGTVLDADKSGPAKVIREKKIVVSDILRDIFNFTENKDLANYNIISVIMVPLLIKGQAIGTLILGSKKALAYTEEDGVFLQQVADQLALCIENSRLYAEESLMKRAWEETFKAVTDMLIVVDRECRVVRFNKSAAEMDWKQQEPLQIGQRCQRYFTSQNGETECKLCPAHEVFVTGRPTTQRIYSLSGKILNICSYPIFNDEGHVNEVINSIRDVTERVHMEAHLIQSAKLAAIGEIAAGIAHELNSPLTAIIGNSLLLQRDSQIYPSEKRELLDDIKKCGIRCKNIILNLRTFARQEQYSFEYLNINSVVESALNLIAYQIEKNCIQIIKKLDINLPLIKGSKQHLEQVLINLILNARDSLEGREACEIHIKTGSQESFIYAAVRDTGCGIEPGQLNQIFKPFYTTKVDGTGLGLSISRNIAQAHGGRIEVESKVGEGSTFYLKIPVEQDQQLRGG